ncbi:TetR/AcrR family transcriptional regulator [Rurimicrobium arvi]|uniref:TetR/AcrR family transcriptional regulator n=1 Tax=Rurimicrobium arvi TaxID=2049916 RepID=A0ABP8MSC7_9BACT
MKEDVRCKILAAAMQISRTEGWQALSMRKIADKIDYTAPIIYEHFANKEALMEALAMMGFKKLALLMQERSQNLDTPEEKILAMWHAYWDFAFAEKEYYQLMYGVQVNCCQFDNKGTDFELPAELIWDQIEASAWAKTKTEEDICKIYYTYWSVAHGLVSINLAKAGDINISEQISQEVFNNAMNAITNSMK